MGLIGRFFIDVFTNKVFLAMLFSFLVSAFTKMSIILASEKHPKLTTIYRSGGMPSTHTAAVTGLTLGVLFGNGVGTLFIITLAFSIIVIHDAMGVRLEAEKHAQFLNKLIKRHKFDKKYFSENLGHNFPEIFVGAVIGIVVSIIIFML